MSVDALVAGVGAALLLVLLLMVLKETCAKKDHNGSESRVMIGKHSTDLNEMFFPLLFVFFSRERQPAAVSLQSPLPPLVSVHPRSSLSLPHRQHDGADAGPPANTPDPPGQAVREHLPPKMWKHK